MIAGNAYDVAIVGGGLAGLATAIQLAQKNISVVLFEKESYPLHRVCGEYISMESRDFLLSLGLPLEQWHLPVITQLRLTSPNGNEFKTSLPLGGFGISRYRLDAALAKLAIDSGVHLLQQTRVDDVTFADGFTINAGGEKIMAKFCAGAFGKRSNLDVKWKRPFVQNKNERLANYVGIKYHVKSQWPEDVIGLHNFKNGYCGISKIEDEKFCLCYLTKASNLKANNNNIRLLEENVLFQNPHLKNIFNTSQFIDEFPVSISQISFAPKSRVENNMLLLGDAAGMITPLCGNGMSIALHTAKIAAGLMGSAIQASTPIKDVNQQYQNAWQKNFSGRLHAGRLLQGFFGSNSLSNIFIGAFKMFPFLAKPVIGLTHGKSF